MPEPYTRLEEMVSALSAQIAPAIYHELDESGSPWLPTIGSGNFTTSAGTPTGQTTDPCFLNPDGTPQQYLKLDPGDILTRSNNGYNLETFGCAWVRVDSFPGADANIWLQLGGDGVGIDSTGKIYAVNAGTKQGTEAGTRTLGEWFFLAKMNDAGGGGTGTFVWINGVRVMTLGGAGGTKNGSTIGSAGFDGAICHWAYDQQSTALTDAAILAIYGAGARKLFQRAQAL